MSPEQMNGSQVFPLPPKMAACQHRHISGRRCTRRVRRSGTVCEACKPVTPSGYCRECLGMAAAFGVTLRTTP